MAFGLPHISFIGYPLSIPCAGHAGLGFRQARPRDAAGVLDHYLRLAAADRRMRFCGTLTDAAIERHVGGIWDRPGFVLAAHDGPLWSGPFYRAGPVRALAELVISGSNAELGLSVDTAMRRQGVGSYMVQTAARLLALRGVTRIVAYTLPSNASFLALAQRCDARIARDLDELTISFEVADLHRAYLRRRLASQVFTPAGWPGQPAPRASSPSISAPEAPRAIAE